MLFTLYIIAALLAGLFMISVAIVALEQFINIKRQVNKRRGDFLTRQSLNVMRFVDRNGQKIKKYAYVFGAHDADVRELVAVGDKAAKELGELDFDIIFCEALVKDEAAEQWGYSPCPMYYDEARSTTTKVSHYVTRLVAKCRLIIKQITVSLIRIGGEENGEEGHAVI